MINLGLASNYAILTKAGITNVPNSNITGDIGASPIASTAITGFSLIANNQYSISSQVTGKVYAANYTVPTPSNLTTAILNMEAAYRDAAGRTPGHTELYTGNLSGKILSPGVYKWSTGVLINSDLNLYGDINDIFIFQIAKGLNLATGIKVILTGGVQAKNIYWQVCETVALGTGSHFEGTILAKTNITLGANASVNGRLLAQTACTLIKNTIVVK
jgi:hypothetical protein